MPREHRVRIHWSQSSVQNGLRDVAQTTDPVWALRARLLGAMKDGAWRFGLNNRRKSREIIDGLRQFLFPERAPPEWLQAGSELQWFERGTGHVARVEVLD